MKVISDQPCAGGADPGESTRGRWWKPLATWALSVAAVLSMLMAFHAVTRGAVRQAQVRHLAISAHAEATWRCRNLRGLRASGDCLLQLNASVQPQFLAQSPNLLSGRPVD
ncbi:MAG: hypothetical protein IAE92_04275 [Burkholderiaceae bacterium]|nr:hypothetical protein [Burkholderiaceae bacterium]